MDALQPWPCIFDKAIADFDEALRRDPACANAYKGRGISWFYNGDDNKSVSDLNEAIRLDPTEMYSQAALAWVLIACPNDKNRNAQRAVELALTACKLSGGKGAYILRTLAAAYAESGDFENAVKWQEKSFEQSSEAEKKEWGFLLDLYKSGRRFPTDSQEFRLGGNSRSSAAYVG